MAQMRAATYTLAMRLMLLTQSCTKAKSVKFTTLIRVMKSPISTYQ
jgi:hypothetical protein